MNSQVLWILLAATLLITACSRPPPPSDSLQVAVRTVHTGALSRDGTQALIGSSQHGGSLWQINTRERLYNWNHQANEYTQLQASAVSPDGGWAITSDGQAVVLWSTSGGASAGFWNMTGQIRAMAMARHGNVAALALNDGRATLYDVRSGNLLQSFTHRGPVNSIAVSDDLSLTLSGGDDQLARVWDNNTATIISERQFSDPLQLVALSADGHLALASARYDRVDIFATDTGELVWNLPFTRERTRRGLTISAVRFSDDGDYLLTGRPDGIVQLWDIVNQSEIYRWQLGKQKNWQPVSTIVMDVSFTADANRYRAISSDGFVHTLSY
ncbi:MAG TPA: WD40 repeat domain-containing protein [Cellvibrionaceae bacterium]